MLILLEIYLTVRAFKAGWKALALLPMGLALAAGIGVGINAPELVRTAPFALVAVDLLAVAVLGAMCARQKAPQPLAPVSVSA
jgi:hypothetical protein